MKLVYLGALALSAIAFADESLPPGSTPDNVSMVSPGVYRGARIENADQMKYVVETLHVKTIVNLQGGDDKSPWIGGIVDFFEAGETNQEISAERQLAIKAGLDPQGYVKAPLNALKELTPREAKRIYDIIAIMNDPERKPVYVHCAHGADRTGLVVALYRLVNQQMGVKEAYLEMVAHGHNLVHQAFTFTMDRAYLKQALKIVNSR